MDDLEVIKEDNYILNKGEIVKSIGYLADCVLELDSALLALRSRLAGDESLRAIIRSFDIAAVYAKECKAQLIKQTKDQLPF